MGTVYRLSAFDNRPRVVEDLKLSIPSKTLGDKHPRETAEVAADVREVVGKLVAEIG